MVDFEFVENQIQPAKTLPSGKKIADRFAAVRSRGVLNAGLDVLGQDYERANPGRGTRWEFFKPSMDGGGDLVIMREGLGWKVVDWSEMPNPTETSIKSGPVRRGDLILMSADLSTVIDQLQQDAEAARVELKSSESAFRESVGDKKVRLSGGDLGEAKGVGTIKVREQFVQPAPDNDANGGQ